MALVKTNLEISDWFSSLKDNVDLWITDPPYPFDSQNGTGRYKDMYSLMSWEQIGKVYEKMYKHTSDGGRVYVFCNRDGIENTKRLLSEAGFRFLNLLVWDKCHFGGGYHWRNQVEYIIYSSKGKPKTYVKNLANIFRYKRPSKNSTMPSIGYDPSGQSCKPMEIWRDIMLEGGCDEDVCADPFSGSNPMMAAYMTNPILKTKFKKVLTNVYK